MIQAIVAGNATTGSVVVALGLTESVSGPTFTVVAPTINTISPSSGPAGTAVVVTGGNFGPDSCCHGIAGKSWAGGEGSPLSADRWRMITVNGTPSMLQGWSQTLAVAGIAGNATSGPVVIYIKTPTTGFDTNGLPIITGASIATATGPTFTVVAPTITSISPTSGPAGTAVVVTGDNFGPDSCCHGIAGKSWAGGDGFPLSSDRWRMITVNGMPSMLQGWSQTQAVAGVAGNATSGPVVMHIKTPTTGFDANGVPVMTGTSVATATGPTFTVIAPTITTISPSSGPAGTAVVVTGDNFGPDLCCHGIAGKSWAGGDGSPLSSDRWRMITVNGIPSMLQGWSQTQAVAGVAGNTTSGPVVMHIKTPTTGFNANGVPIMTGSSIATATGPTFTVVAPTITSISPSSGPAGTAVVVTGNSFGPNLCCHGIAGKSWAGGDGSPLSSDRWRMITVNGTPSLLTGWSETQAIATVAGNATSGLLVMHIKTPTTGFDANGVPIMTGSSIATATGATFTVVAPTITSISPISGPAGTAVVVTGDNFGSDSCCHGIAGKSWAGGDGSPLSSDRWRMITVNGTPSMLQGWSQTQAVAGIAGNATSGPVVMHIKTPTTGFDANGVPIMTGSSIATAIGPTFIVMEPTITNISPSSGPIGTAIMVTGDNFGPDLCCYGIAGKSWAGGDGSPLSSDRWRMITVNGTPSLLLGWSPTQSVAGVAGNAASGPVVMHIKTPTTGFNANGVPIMTGTSIATATGPTFTVVAPAITSVSPSSGPVGTSITIVGVGFGQILQSVFVNSISAVIASWSDSQINTQIPAGVADGVASIVVRLSASTTGFDTNGVPIVTGIGVVSSNVNTDFMVGVVPTHTSTPIPTDTPAPTATPTPTYTPTPMPTATSTATATNTSTPTATPTPGPSQAVSNLITAVNTYISNGNITGGVGTGLLNKLQNAQQKLDRGQMNAAANELQAFINAVQAQRGKKITTIAADDLIAQAQAIINQIQAA